MELHCSPTPGHSASSRKNDPRHPGGISPLGAQTGQSHASRQSLERGQGPWEAVDRCSTLVLPPSFPPETIPWPSGVASHLPLQQGGLCREQEEE